VIAIRTLTAPGDVVTVDSPSFYGTMQILKANGLKALEIPTDPCTGISLEALEMALEQWPIWAIQVTPTCNNPLGYTMPESRKRALVACSRVGAAREFQNDVLLFSATIASGCVGQQAATAGAQVQFSTTLPDWPEPMTSKSCSKSCSKSSMAKLAHLSVMGCRGRRSRTGSHPRRAPDARP
jgi:aspartate/methionine/tyrosine aminotransferase